MDKKKSSTLRDGLYIIRSEPMRLGQVLERGYSLGYMDPWGSISGVLDVHVAGH